MCNMVGSYNVVSCKCERDMAWFVIWWDKPQKNNFLVPNVSQILEPGLWRIVDMFFFYRLFVFTKGTEKNKTDTFIYQHPGFFLQIACCQVKDKL